MKNSKDFERIPKNSRVNSPSARVEWGRFVRFTWLIGTDQRLKENLRDRGSEIFPFFFILSLCFFANFVVFIFRYKVFVMIRFPLSAGLGKTRASILPTSGNKARLCFAGFSITMLTQWHNGDQDQLFTIPASASLSSPTQDLLLRLLHLRPCAYRHNKASATIIARVVFFVYTAYAEVSLNPASMRPELS